jgi:prefoldin subunit 5
MTKPNAVPEQVEVEVVRADLKKRLHDCDEQMQKMSDAVTQLRQQTQKIEARYLQATGYRALLVELIGE